MHRHDKTVSLALLALLALVATAASADESATAMAADAEPAFQSLSVLAFAGDGTLFVGDGKGGAVYAFDLGERQPPAADAKLLRIFDIEAKIAALLGTSADEVMVHDLAVDPISQAAYLAVSRGRGQWKSTWELPNDVADADVLVTIGRDGQVGLVDLAAAEATRAELPAPVDAAKTHPWKKGVTLRADTITDIAFDGETLFVAGLSNEEFASTLWKLPYPFTDGASMTTLEVFHGAHGEWETHAPIRTFVPYRLRGRPHLLAAYLCTPFVVFPTEDLADGEHVRGRTVAEFGSGNAPLDMIVYEKNGDERILIANSNLPMMVVRTAELASWKGSLTERPESYMAGLPYEPRAGNGVVQLDRLNADVAVVLKRQPSGKLDLVPVPFSRF